jgi:hypothetical protein
MVATLSCGFRTLSDSKQRCVKSPPSSFLAFPGGKRRVSFDKAE